MKGFEYHEKISIIMGKSIACGWYAFHPSYTEPPVAIEEDGEDGEGSGDGKVKQGDDPLGRDPPIDPSAMQNIVTSAPATASVSATSHFPLANTSSTFSTTSPTLADNLTNLIDIDPVLMANDHQPIMSADDAATSALGRKCKVLIIHSPGSIISTAHLAPSTFNTPSSSNPLSGSSLDPSLCAKQGGLTSKVQDTRYLEVPHPQGLKKFLESDLFWYISHMLEVFNNNLQ